METFERLTISEINLFRVAFLLERMCPLKYGLGSKFNETYFDEYKAAIDHITVTNGACELAPVTIVLSRQLSSDMSIRRDSGST